MLGKVGRGEKRTTAISVHLSTLDWHQLIDCPYPELFSEEGECVSE